MKPRIKLRVVPPAVQRPAEHIPVPVLSDAEKLAEAIAWLRQRGRYVLDRGTPAPKWGVAGEPKRVPQRIIYRSAPTIMERFAETISTLWRAQ